MAGLNIYVRRWRTALHATVSALIVAILGLAITPVANAATARATLSVTSTWQTGFIARFTITNSSTAPLTDWKLEFDLPAGESVLHTWNSTVARSGTHYVLSPANWNRIIAPGGSATGGLRGGLTGSYSPPSSCLLNGQYPCTSTRLRTEARRLQQCGYCQVGLVGRHGQRHLGVDADGARALGLVMTRRLPEPRNWIDRSAGGGLRSGAWASTQ